MDDDQPPRRLLLDAGLSLLALPGEIRPREGRAFLVTWEKTAAVLRSVPTSEAAGTRMADRVADIRWLHSFLSRLVALGFPAPDPLPAFGGESWVHDGDEIWEIVSYLPGRSVGWSPQPPMESLGAFLARYHEAARQVSVTTQRPTALPLVDVPRVLLASELGGLGIDVGQANAIRRLAEQLARDLEDAERALPPERLVIHGDFTNDNVIASGALGAPLRTTGVIDFALAHLERPLADIGYALWRSGRPGEQAIHLDLTKIGRYIHGYASVAPLTAAQVDAIPTYLVGRGLQMIAKRVRRGSADIGMLAEVEWLDQNRRAIGDAVRAALWGRRRRRVITKG